MVETLKKQKESIGMFLVAEDIKNLLRFCLVGERGNTE